MQEAQQIRLEIPSRAEYVSVVRNAVEGIAARMRFSPDDVSDVKLAVGEACNNAVRHGCPSKQNPSVTVILSVTPDSLSIEVRNSVSGGKPCPVPTPPDASREGGMGLYIMNRLMDEVVINWHGRMASIRMVKHLPQYDCA